MSNHELNGVAPTTQHRTTAAPNAPPLRQRLRQMRRIVTTHITSQIKAIGCNSVSTNRETDCVTSAGYNLQALI